MEAITNVNDDAAKAATSRNLNEGGISRDGSTVFATLVSTSVRKEKTSSGGNQYLCFLRIDGFGPAEVVRYDEAAKEFFIYLRAWEPPPPQPHKPGKPVKDPKFLFHRPDQGTAAAYRMWKNKFHSFLCRGAETLGILPGQSVVLEGVQFDSLKPNPGKTELRGRDGPSYGTLRVVSPVKIARDLLAANQMGMFDIDAVAYATSNDTHVTDCNLFTKSLGIVRDKQAKKYAPRPGYVFSLFPMAKKATVLADLNETGRDYQAAFIKADLGNPRASFVRLEENIKVKSYAGSKSSDTVKDGVLVALIIKSKGEISAVNAIVSFYAESFHVFGCETPYMWEAIAPMLISNVAGEVFVPVSEFNVMSSQEDADEAGATHVCKSFPAAPVIFPNLRQWIEDAGFEVPVDEWSKVFPISDKGNAVANTDTDHDIGMYGTYIPKPHASKDEFEPGGYQQQISAYYTVCANLHIVARGKNLNYLIYAARKGAVKMILVPALTVKELRKDILDRIKAESTYAGKYKLAMENSSTFRDIEGPMPSDAIFYQLWILSNDETSVQSYLTTAPTARSGIIPFPTDPVAAEAEWLKKLTQRKNSILKIRTSPAPALAAAAPAAAAPAAAAPAVVAAQEQDVKRVKVEVGDVAYTMTTHVNPAAAAAAATTTTTTTEVDENKDEDDEDEEKE